MQVFFKNRRIFVGAAIFFVSASLLLAAQQTPTHATSSGMAFNVIFGLLELPFLVLCVAFAFLTAGNLRGGIFGNGMMLIAWGFLVMGVGHLHMQIEHFFNLNIFNSLLGPFLGRFAWFFALIATWTLSGLGFYRIFKASRGG